MRHRVLRERKFFFVIFVKTGDLAYFINESSTGGIEIPGDNDQVVLVFRRRHDEISRKDAQDFGRFSPPRQVNKDYFSFTEEFSRTVCQSLCDNSK